MTSAAFSAYGWAMATRYCGRTRLTVSLTDKDTAYKVAAYQRGQRIGSVKVGIPPASRLAVDSKEAYTSAARAAVSFMSGDRDSPLDDGDLDFTDSGPRITEMPTDRVRVSIRKIPLNRQGYTKAGRYFGTGAPLYEAEVTTQDRYVGNAFVRAPNRQVAAEHLHAELKRKRLIP